MLLHAVSCSCLESTIRKQKQYLLSCERIDSWKGYGHIVIATVQSMVTECFGCKLVSNVQVVRSMITSRRLSRMLSNKLSIAEALMWLCRAEPTSKECIEAIKAWTDKTPARAALLAVNSTSVSHTDKPSCIYWGCTEHLPNVLMSLMHVFSSTLRLHKVDLLNTW